MLSSRTRAMWMGSTQQPAYVVKRVEPCVADDGSASAHIAHYAQFVIGSAFCACSADRASTLLPLRCHLIRSPPLPSPLSSHTQYPRPQRRTLAPHRRNAWAEGRGRGGGRRRGAG